MTLLKFDNKILTTYEPIKLAAHFSIFQYAFYPPPKSMPQKYHKWKLFISITIITLSAVKNKNKFALHLFLDKILAICYNKPLHIMCFKL